MDASLERDLLAHQGFLRRLARELVGDDAAAEDLVQEANVRALTRPPKDRGALRAWLATVARRLAASEFRSGGRRADRERAAARPERTSGGLPELDRRLDAQALVLELMKKLPDAQRQALLLRYADELSLGAISRRLSESPETIKTRLRRGLERLRVELDRAHGGERGTWALALVPTALELAPMPLEGSGPLTAGLSGGLRLGWVVATTVAAGAAALLGSTLLFPEGPRGSGAAPVVELARAELVPGEETVRPGTADPSGTSREEAEAVPQDPATLDLSASMPLFLTVPPDPAEVFEGPAWPLLIRTEGAQAPGASVEVRARFAEYGTAAPEPLRGAIGTDGTKTFDVGPMLREAAASPEGRLAELLVVIDDDHLVPAEASLVVDPTWDPGAAPPHGLEVVLRIESAAVIVGRLVRPELAARLDPWTPGEGSADELHVAAYRLEGSAPGRRPSGGASVEPDGSFRLRIDGEGAFVFLGLGNSTRPLTLPVDLARGTVTDLGTLRLDAGAFLSGHLAEEVHAASGGVVTVCASHGVPADSWHETGTRGFTLTGHVVWLEGAFEHHGACVKTDDEGAFFVSGLRPGPYSFNTHLQNWRAPFALEQPQVIAPASGVVLGPRGALLTLTLVLPENTVGSETVWDFVSEEDGVVLAESSFDTGGGEGWKPRDGEVVVRIDGEERTEDVHGAGLLGDANLRFELPPGREVELELRLPGIVPTGLSLTLPGRAGRVTRELVLEPEGDPADLRLVFGATPVSEGEPFVVVYEPEGQAEVEEALVVENGGLSLRGLPAGPIRFTLTRGRDRFAPADYWTAAEFELTLRPTEQREHRVALGSAGALVIELLDDQGRRVDGRCTLVGPDGVELRPVFVANDRDGGRIAGHGFLFACGPNRAIPDLPPGRYEVRARANGVKTSETVELRAGETVVRKIRLQGP